MGRTTAEQVCKQDRKILQMLAIGKSVPEIARTLKLAERHVQRRIAEMRARYEVLAARRS
jgi:DNA-binding NarL/FixJ family response regulator